MKKALLLLSAIIVAFSFSACSKKASKEQAIEFYNKMGEYIASPEFRNAFAATFDKKDSTINFEKIQNSINSIVNEKQDKVAKDMGFRSAEDIKKDETLMNMPEVSAAVVKFNKTVMMHAHLIIMGENPETGMGGMHGMGGMGGHGMGGMHGVPGDDKEMPKDSIHQH